MNLVFNENLREAPLKMSPKSLFYSDLGFFFSP